MRRELDLLLCAIQFLTRLPVPPSPRFQPDWIARSSRYFPLVGQVVGLIAGAVLIGAHHVWPAWIAALLAIAVGIAVTGGFHEDGLADTADGLGGGSTVARRLEIMKDSRVGTYGVLALGLVLALKTAALAALVGQSVWSAAVALVAAHGAARAAAVGAMRASPYAGDPQASKLKPVPQGVSGVDVLIAASLSLWPLAFLPPGESLQGIALGGAGAFATALLAQRLIGGHTGDVLGAIEQAFETGFLLGVAAGWRG